MRIQQYLNKINVLCIAESIIEHSDNVELENLIAKNLLSINEIYFTLDTLFQKSADKSIAINFEIVNQIANRLVLIFINEKEKDTNVCFANSDELRSEFRQSFTSIDLLDYSYAILHSSIFKKGLNNDSQKIPIPLDSNVFWKLVQIGSDLRINENSIK